MRCLACDSFMTDQELSLDDELCRNCLKSVKECNEELDKLKDEKNG
jgi:hypothetical protein